MNRTAEQKRPEQIESELEQTRAEVSSTIEAIQSKLTPGQMMDQGIDYLRGSMPADFGRNLAQQVRDNPLPVALIGLGVAWLAMSSGQKAPLHSTGYAANEPLMGETDTGESTTAALRERIGSGMASAKERLGSSVSGARERMHHTRERVHEARERLAERTRETAARVGELRDRSRDRYYRTRDRASHIVHEQPLVLAALGLALGAAFGARLPPSRREDELMGAMRDDLLGRAADTAREGVQTLRETTHQAIDKAEQKVKGNGGGMEGEHAFGQPGESHGAHQGEPMHERVTEEHITTREMVPDRGVNRDAGV